MEIPANPYRKGSMIWSVMEGDWEDLTVDQIAEVLFTSPEVISRNIFRLNDHRLKPVGLSRLKATNSD